jgi:sulfide:quinone oxidoreductase
LEITVVDRDDIHPYQLGFMFRPFGSYAPKQLTRSRHAQLDDGMTFLTGDVHRVDPVERCVTLWDDRMLSYDYLVIASGTEPRPDKTPGMLGPEWRRSIFDFYTLHGTLALAKALPRLDHRRLVVHITDMPIKCPVAPLEFASLADAWLRDRGLRDRIELVFVIPLSGAFTRSVAAQHLGSMLDERKILVERDFRVERVERRTLVSYDGREVPFDLLVTVPLNMDAEYTALRPGRRAELRAGRPAYPAVDRIPDDLRARRRRERPRDQGRIRGALRGRDLCPQLPGAGGRQAHDRLVRRTRQLLRRVGPRQGAAPGLQLRHRAAARDVPDPGRRTAIPAKETRANHLGKLAFRWINWNLLLPGLPLPIPTRMSLLGKDRTPASPSTPTAQERPPCPPRPSTATRSTTTTKPSSPEPATLLTNLRPPPTGRLPWTARMRPAAVEGDAGPPS